MSRVKFLLPSLLLACLSSPALAGKYCTKLPDASVIGDTKTFYKFDWNYPKGPHTWAMKLVTSYAAWNGDVYYDQEDVPLRTWPKSHARKYTCVELPKVSEGWNNARHVLNRKPGDLYRQYGGIYNLRTVTTDGVECPGSQHINHIHRHVHVDLRVKNGKLVCDWK